MVMKHHIHPTLDDQLPARFLTEPPESMEPACGTPTEGDCGSRIINLCEPIKPSVAERAVLQLLQYETADPGTPIHMYLFSPGGCVPSGLAIIDAMHHVTSPVFTYCFGYAASMAAVILACGERDHRYILPRSRVMIHQASGSVGGTMENVRATLAFQSALESETDELLAKSSGRSVGEIRDASRVDNWMDAGTAVSFGLVDHILTPHRR